MKENVISQSCVKYFRQSCLGFLISQSFIKILILIFLSLIEKITSLLNNIAKFHPPHQPETYTSRMLYLDIFCIALKFKKKSQPSCSIFLYYFRNCHTNSISAKIDIIIGKFKTKLLDYFLFFFNFIVFLYQRMVNFTIFFTIWSICKNYLEMTLHLKRGE